MEPQIPTHLCLVRHADVDNGPPPGRLCGWLDLPISARGRARVDALCKRASRRSAPDVLYGSTLARARQTVAALATVWRLDAQLEDDLREINCGQFEGMSIARLQREYPDLWSLNVSQSADEFTWPGGESYRLFHQRAVRAVARIAANHAGQRVVIVTHAGVITQILNVLRQRPAAVWDAERARPLTATELVWAGGEPRALLRFDETDWI